jgi:hypothetical protein
MANTFLNTQSTRQTGAATTFMNRVYLFMTLGLLISAAVAYFMHSHPLVNQYIAHSSFTFFGIVIAQLAAVLFFSRTISTMNKNAAFTLFFIYSALTGVTFGLLTLIYAVSSISLAFAITAGSFLGLSLIGYTTKKDLSPIRSFCMMGLIGLILISLLAFFIPALRGSVANLTMAAIGVIVFSGLTAYDTQKIKSMGAMAGYSDLVAIQGAFMLYLDFINLFISILRFFNDRK